MPLRFKQAVLFNAPTIFDMFWNIVSPFLKQKTRERVCYEYIMYRASLVCLGRIGLYFNLPNGYKRQLFSNLANMIELQLETMVDINRNCLTFSLCHTFSSFFSGKDK